MSGALFLQSEVHDPYALYAECLSRAPVQYDSVNGLWAIYSYAGCAAVLASPDADIPRSALDHLQDEAELIARHLVRLANPPTHALLRRTAQQLFDRLASVESAGLIERLLRRQGREFDWVAGVCKPLPPLMLMHGLGFAASSIDRLLPQVDMLAKLMLPVKPEPLLADVQHAAQACWPLLQVEAARLVGGRDDEAAANLAGLLIQSLDATRGLLSNALLTAFTEPEPPMSPAAWRSLVHETLRWDPPIQNTRRVLTRQAVIEGVSLPAGAQVLLALASANRDPAMFAQPDRFLVKRENSSAHLTFGLGPHACLAREYAVLLAAQTLTWFFRNGGSLLSRTVAYEPLINARLPKEMRVQVVE